MAACGGLINKCSEILQLQINRLRICLYAHHGRLQNVLHAEVWSLTRAEYFLSYYARIKFMKGHWQEGPIHLPNVANPKMGR